MRGASLALALLLAGCAGRLPTPAAPAPDEAFRRVQQVLSGRPAAPGPAFDAALARWRTAGGRDCAHPLESRYFQSRLVEGAGRAATSTSVSTTTAPAVAATSTSAACPPRVPFLVSSAREGQLPVWVDPQRVRAIHVVFAGNGQGAASRFGHVALRLVICPASTSTDEACALNVREHLLVGFMAHVDTFGISMMKGLSGHYRAHLVATRFLDAYQQYAIGEFRELYSVPLHLDTAPREQMVRELAQIHWQYEGDYTFFGRNCASLLQQALRVLLPAPEAGVASAGGRAPAEDPALAVDRVRPDRFFAALRRSPLLDTGVLADLHQAEHDGFYFPGTRPYHEQAATLLAQSLEAVPWRGLDGYLATPAAQRRALLTAPANAARLRADAHLAGAAQILEGLALLQAERRFGSQLAQTMDKYRVAERAPALRARLDPVRQRVLDNCLVAPLQATLGPVQRRDGIPAGDLPSVSVADLQSACLEGDAPAQLQGLLREFSDGDARPWQRAMGAARDWGEAMGNLLALQELSPGR